MDLPQLSPYPSSFLQANLTGPLTGRLTTSEEPAPSFALPSWALRSSGSAPPKPSFLNAASLFKLPSVYTGYSLTLECSHHTLPFQSSSSASFFLLGTHTKCHRTQEALWVEPGEPSLGTCSDGTLCSNISIGLHPSFSLDHQIPGGRRSLRHLQTQLRVRHTKGISRPTQLPKET